MYLHSSAAIKTITEEQKKNPEEEVPKNIDEGIELFDDPFSNEEEQNEVPVKKDKPSEEKPNQKPAILDSLQTFLDAKGVEQPKEEVLLAHLINYALDHGMRN